MEGDYEGLKSILICSFHLLINTLDWTERLSIIYFIMGCLSLIPIKQMLPSMTIVPGILLFTGGAFFTLGGLIYAIKKPRLVPGIFSFHELFHVMVLIGSGLHYAMIYIVYFQKVA